MVAHSMITKHDYLKPKLDLFYIKDLLYQLFKPVFLTHASFISIPADNSLDLRLNN